MVTGGRGVGAGLSVSSDTRGEAGTDCETGSIGGRTACVNDLAEL